MTAKSGSLSGKRILIVEDEFIVAATAADMISGFGATVIGPAYNLQQGLALAGSEALDGALLDINLNRERSDEIARTLIRRGVPIVFATGYGQAAEKVGDARVLDKPFSEQSLERALAEAMAG